MTRTAAVLLTAAGGIAPATEPAARLLPARPVESSVSRAAAPDFDPKAKSPAPARTWTGQPQTAVPPPVATKPTAPPPVQAQPAPAGVYAGPPAWRWYGYGTTTPGANPLAPAGQYPKGSANWYAQTKATPGAFPVPVTAGGDPVPRFEPPVYASVAPPPEPPRSAPTFTYSPPPAVASVAPPPPAFVPPPPPVMVAAPEPVRVPAEPRPIAVSVPVEAPAPATPTVVPPPSPTHTGVAWQSSGNRDSLTFAPARPTATVEPPPIATSSPKAVEPAPFKPVLPPAPTVAPPAPLPNADWKAAPQARGQADAPPAVPLAAQVRNACYGLAAVEAVTHTGPTTITVRLVAATEADARLAAASVAKLPALKPYAVKFQAELTGR